MARKKKRTTPSDIDLARANVELEYGPQFAQVRDLLGQARSEFSNDLSSARNTAKAAQGYIDQSRPRVKQIYGSAASGQKTAEADVDKALANYSQPATPLGGLLGQMMQRERGAAQSAINTAKTNALGDLEKRGAEVQAGKALAYTAARQKLTSTRKQLGQRLADLTGMSSAAVMAELGKIGAERAKTDAAGAKTITSGPFAGYTQSDLDNMSPEAKRKIAASSGSKAKSKKPRATRDQVKDLSDEFSQALNEANKYKDTNSRSSLAKVLLAGQSPTKEDPTSVKSFGQLATTLALDMAYDGHISRANARRLHSLGYTVEDLTGAKSYTQFDREFKRKHANRKVTPRLPGGVRP
jgi:hypothetical protein